MAHKTFISYKYSESVDLRDRIIKALGEDAKYYNGENGFSPNMSNDKDEKIWNYLKEMIWGTSVTIVIISPNMRQSDWIEKEISYSLKKVSRDGTQSQRNGVVAVIKNINGNCSWFLSFTQNNDGCHVRNYKEDCVLDIIRKNRNNHQNPRFICDKCKSVDPLTNSYISYVTEDDFINNPQCYIKNAYDKSLNDCEDYKISIE